MPRKIVEQPKVEHICAFHEWADKETLRCGCGRTLISQSALNRRTAEWESFYELNRQSNSYATYQQIRQAWPMAVLTNNFNEVRALAAEAKQRLAEDNYIPCPPYPDPATYSYVVKGVDTK